MKAEQKRLAEKMIMMAKDASGVIPYAFHPKEYGSFDDFVLVKNYLIDEGYMRMDDVSFNAVRLLLTKKGWEFTSFEEMEKRQRMDADLAKRKLLADLANSENTLRTYRTTRFLAWIGAGISLVLFILKILEYLKLIRP